MESASEPCGCELKFLAHLTPALSPFASDANAVREKFSGRFPRVVAALQPWANFRYAFSVFTFAFVTGCQSTGGERLDVVINGIPAPLKGHVSSRGLGRDKGNRRYQLYAPLISLASTLTRSVTSAAMIMHTPPATTAVSRLTCGKESITRLRISATRICGMTMKKLKMPM